MWGPAVFNSITKTMILSVPPDKFASGINIAYLYDGYLYILLA